MDNIQNDIDKFNRYYLSLENHKHFPITRFYRGTTLARIEFFFDRIHRDYSQLYGKATIGILIRKIARKGGRFSEGRLLKEKKRSDD
jgi:hypothetical protein